MFKAIAIFKLFAALTSTVTVQDYTVMSPNEAVEDNVQMVSSVDQKSGQELWFTYDQVVGSKDIEPGDKVIGFFSNRLEEDQFIVLH